MYKRNLMIAVTLVFAALGATCVTAQDVSHVQKINSLLATIGFDGVSPIDCLTDNKGTSCFVNSEDIIDWVPFYKCFILLDKYDRVVAEWDENYQKKVNACND